ncbi:MAG: guanylate kinase [Magnetococcales bacterium]|nr:guanylate kinase [Magnetococcales bacterium]HIJ83467.1 guanylate kinase [Magnetococcales bacterium]
MDEMKRGFILILTAPSGGGKGVLSRHLVEKMDGIRFSVSTTTRMMRPGEVDGVHYFFVGKDEFEKKIREEAFVEWAAVFGHFYGTSRQMLTENLQAGQDVILDIDWQGARQIRGQMPGDVVHVAIVPPSRDELRRRLVLRGQDAQEVIERRMALAEKELSHWHEADYVLVNDRLEQAYGDIEAIVRAERLRRGRMAGRVEKIVAGFGGNDGLYQDGSG